MTVERTRLALRTLVGIAVAVALAPAAGAAPQYKDAVLASKSAERKAIEDNFKQADRNGDKKLDRKEADGLLGMDSAAFREADKDKSKDLSKEEYADWRIEQIQKHLLTLGYTPGPLDGNLSPETRGALRKYAQDEGLTGAGTQAVMNRLTLQAAEASVEEVRAHVGAEAQGGQGKQQANGEKPGGQERQQQASGEHQGDQQKQQASSGQQGGQAEQGAAKVANLGDEKGNKPAQKVLKHSFKELDLDDNNAISWEEAQFSKPLRSHWQRADENDDGKISRSEFSALEARLEPPSRPNAHVPPSARGGEGVHPPPSRASSKKSQP